MEWQYIVMIIALCIFYIGYFLFFYFVMLKNSRKRKCLRSFYRILKVLYDKKLSLSEAIAQLKLDYNQLCLDPTCICNYRLLELLNLIVYYLDTNAIYRLSNVKDFDKNEIEQIRNFVLNIRNQINIQDPFSILSEKEASLMNSIQTTIDPNMINSGNDFLLQLSNELQSKEKLLHKEKQKSSISTFLSIISIFLTILFGVLSFV